ncbi:hypothetical protein [Streptomyces lavendulocolor]|uniref:hypothetical protein n=1 Tax=Streptomyces lavendulocolor TaxID=67316 RepID=UPI0033EC7B95
MDGDALDAAISAYLQARTPRMAGPEAKKEPVRQVIAVDGKVVPGSRTATAAAIQLLAVMGPPRRGPGPAADRLQSDEIPSFAPLLRGAA